SLIHQVGQVGARKAWGAASKDVDIHVRRQGYFSHVHFEDLRTSTHVGQGNHYLPVEAARAKQGRVEYVWAVSCRNDNDPLVGFEAIHFNQHLVEGLLALIVAATESGTALATHSIDFVNKQNAGRVL